MHGRFIRWIPCVTVFLFAARMVSVNPIGPGNVAVVSEVQVIDATHWSIELNLQAFGSSLTGAGAAFYIGTYSQGCTSSLFRYRAKVLASSIALNKQYIGVISSSQCPDVTINPARDTVVVGIDSTHAMWSVPIDSLTPCGSIWPRCRRACVRGFRGAR